MRLRRYNGRGVTAGALALGCLGLAFSGLRGSWLPGPALVKDVQVSPPSEEAAELQGCDAALEAGAKELKTFQDGWIAAIDAERLLLKFGKTSLVAGRKIMGAFNAVVKAQELGDTCSRQRASLEQALKKLIWAVYLRQRQLTEQVTMEDLEESLLRKMRKRGEPLRVQEKIDMLQEAVASYKQRVGMIFPDWAFPNEVDAEEADVERRLGDLQFSIETSAGGRHLQDTWERGRIHRMLNERAHGLSVSLDPGVRVMVRPEGLGNLQVFSEGPVGPPNSPIKANVGIMNDGSIADVYREHPVPPLFAFQPAVKVNLNLR